MKTIKSKKMSSYWFFLLTIALLLGLAPYAATAANMTVQAQIGQFALQDVTVNTGDTVTWVAQSVSGGVHTVTGDPTGTANGAPGPNAVCQDSMNAYLLNAGDMYPHQFNTPGLCSYVCLVHIDTSDMRGTVTVNGVTTTTTATTTSSSTTTTTTTTTLPTTTTTTTLPNHPPSNDSLTPVNISTVPSVAQSFNAGYSDPDGYQNITDASLALSGSVHSETLHYNPATNRFTLQGVGGNCGPGQATTLSNAYLTLNCASSSASGSGNNLTLTYNLTPQPPISGAAYRLILAVSDQAGANSNRDMGYWVVNRRPTAESITPMNSTTPVGTPQTFVSVYSDPDGYQNIAEANFYMAGGLHNEWLHYVSAANIFFIMGAPGVCIPGQATTLTNGFLTLDCAASSVLGSGNVLTVTFRVTPLAPSSGINYSIFTGASDQAGAAHGLFAGTWGIP